MRAYHFNVEVLLLHNPKQPCLVRRDTNIHGSLKVEKKTVTQYKLTVNACFGGCSHEVASLVLSNCLVASFWFNETLG